MVLKTVDKQNGGKRVEPRTKRSEYAILVKVWPTFVLGSFCNKNSFNTFNTYLL